MLGRAIAVRLHGTWRPVIHRCCASQRQLTTLERRIGDKIGTDEIAFEQGNFDGSVYPDLPIVGPAMANGIEEAIRNRVQDASARESLVVRTVAAQCLDAERIAQKIDRAGNLFRDSKNVRGALLCVSGGDAERDSGGSELKDSRFILAQAATMKARGDIPETVDVWAVANPMVDSVDSYMWKVDAGARCFLTQPPFLSECSRAWFEQVARQSRDEDVDILVGVPMITSLKNLDFWLHLCGVSDVTEQAKALKASFPGASMESGDAASSSYSADAVIEWNASFVRDVALKMPGVTGMHVMPVTEGGLGMMRQVLSIASS